MTNSRFVLARGTRKSFLLLARFARTTPAALLCLNLLLLFGVALGVKLRGRPESVVHAAGPRPAANAPTYTADGKMQFPEKYREWIYLTTGMDMSYTPGSGAPGHSTFDNVFVNPEAYRAFLNTGTWPDKTVILIEARAAVSRGSINQRGHFQGMAMALEVHVKDDARTPGGWAFYEFNRPTTAQMVPKTADCYSCHEQHAAVDTTFVQFYPTLFPIAKQKNTLSPEFLKENAANQQ